MSYKVTDTREISTMTPGGTRQTLYRVWLVTERGASGTVDVPAAKWEAGKLREVLDQKAAELNLAFEVALGE